MEYKENGGAFLFSMEGGDAVLLNHGDSLQLYVKVPGKPARKTLDDWNQQHRFTRAYLSNDGTPRLESNLQTSGGTTQSAVVNFINSFRSPLREFSALVAPAEQSQRRLPGLGRLMKGDGKSDGDEKTSEKPAKKPVRAAIGDFVLWVDPAKWKQKRGEKPNIVQFTNSGFDVEARMISERISVPDATLKQVVLANARDTDPKARIVLDETRNVNGRDVLALKTEASVNGAPWIYYGYYRGGSSGTVQVITFGRKDVMAAHEKELTEFLNGLEASDKDLSDPGRMVELAFNDGKFKLAYDSRKWNPESPKDGRYQFVHRSEEVRTLAIVQSQSVPLDSLPEIALANMRKTDPNAKIVSREKSAVRGVPVWRLEFSAEFLKIPYTYRGVYYGGPAGTLQVMVFGPTENFAKHESDIAALLDGITIKHP